MRDTQGNPAWSGGSPNTTPLAGNTGGVQTLVCACSTARRQPDTQGISSRDHFHREAAGPCLQRFNQCGRFLFEKRRKMRMFNSLRKRITELKPFPSLARFRGATFVLDPKNWIDKRLISGVYYEGRQLDAAVDIVRNNDVKLVFDIGANFGLYAVILGMMPNIQTVYAFEPVSRNVSQLHASRFANRLWHKIRIFPFGLSDTDLSADIHIDPTSTGVSRLNLDTAGRDTGVFREREVIALRVFDRIEGFEAISHQTCFLKIDVEGEAVSVLAGMSGFLARNICYLQVELSEAEYSGATRLLDGLGYRNTGRIDGDYYFERKG